RGGGADPIFMDKGGRGAGIAGGNATEPMARDSGAGGSGGSGDNGSNVLSNF
ncbi:hypothetical protein A2U01_0062435, partial [Trifolium medium]|nr:hypothetical protein [Trifolium medium]